MQNNFTATEPPTFDDDETKGYEVGSLWLFPTFVNTASLRVLIQSAAGAAIWKELTPHEDGRDPGMQDDDVHGNSRGQMWTNNLTGAVFVCRDATTDAADWKQLVSPAE